MSASTSYFYAGCYCAAPYVAGKDGSLAGLGEDVSSAGLSILAARLNAESRQQELCRLLLVAAFKKRVAEHLHFLWGGDAASYKGQRPAERSTQLGTCSYRKGLS